MVQNSLMSQLLIIQGLSHKQGSERVSEQMSAAKRVSQIVQSVGMSEQCEQTDDEWPGAPVLILSGSEPRCYIVTAYHDAYSSVLSSAYVLIPVPSCKYLHG